jgi:radical SAM-linked protein
MWERALRRSRLPMAYSQGFSPHPLVSFGLALPTGCESLGEYLDIRLEAAGPAEIPLADLPAVLSELLPEGIDVQAAALIGEAEGSLQQEVASCDWELEVLGVRGEELQERVENMLAARVLTVSRERKGRQSEDDIRPAIRALSLTSPNGLLRADLATHPRGVRPGDLVAALGAPAVAGRA